MKFEKITIENFRGISRLEIGDLQRLNLFVGRNNCGKTSALEAFFLLSGMSNPQLAVNIHNFRDLVLDDDLDFSYMFRNLDLNIPIQLSGIVDSVNRNLTISPFFNSLQPPKGSTLNLRSDNSASATKSNTVDGINFDFETPSHEKHHASFHIKEGRLKTISNYKEELPCTFSNNRISHVVNDKQFEQLIISKNLASIIRVLKEVEPTIQDIRMGARGRIYADIGAERLIPLNVMGDGMRKILSLLTTVAFLKNGVLIIDEIENGMHYSSLSILWKALSAACKEYNVQIIATTHSYECIEAFTKIAETTPSNNDDIRLFRLNKDEDRHSAFAFTTDELKTGIEKGFEVR